MSGLNGKARCLVTGVAGFVGSHLAERLLSENHCVVGVDNFFSGHRENLASLLDHPGFTFHERSIAEAGLLRDLKTQHPDLESCFHLAAIVSVPYSLGHPEATMEVNHQATVHLLHEAERLDFRVFVFAGSAAEYGDDQRLPLMEEYATEKTRHLSAYGRSKYLASREVATSLCGIALRFFNIYGPRQDPSSPYSGVISRFISMALAQEPLTVFGDGLQTRDFIYVADVVEAYLCAAELCRHSSGPGKRLYNIGTGKSTSILELAESINELAASREIPVFCSERPGDIRFSAGSVDAFLRATEWQPRVSLREGLRNTIKWAKGGAPRRGK
jgi:UDP-glucose 4-epimerase